MGWPPLVSARSSAVVALWAPSPRLIRHFTPHIAPSASVSTPPSSTNPAQQLDTSSVVGSSPSAYPTQEPPRPPTTIKSAFPPSDPPPSRSVNYRLDAVAKSQPQDPPRIHRSSPPTEPSTPPIVMVPEPPIPTPRPERPTPLPRPARTALPRSPSVALDASNLPSKLPETTRELLALMRHLAISSEPHRTSHSPFPLHHLCSFHADARIAHLVTTDTYLFLLRRAYAVSNYKLAEHLLTELTDRGFSRNDEAIVRLVHRYALKRGNGQLAFEERQRLKSQGLAALECINSRRDLLEDGKGQGDAIVAWKGRERGRVPRKRRVFYETLRSSTSSSWGKKHDVKPPMGTPDSHHVIDRLSTLFKRAPSTRSPSDVTKLASVDIATLVDSYVLDRNAQRAFESARVWLDHTRRSLINTHANLNANPTTTPPTTVATSPPLPPDLARQTHHLQACRSYEQTALVLLNILLKSLYASRVSTTSIRTFVLTYLDQHSLPQRWKLRPALTTLRTLVVGNTGYHGSWGRSVKLVTWFDQQFGPIERLELEWVQGPKHHFARRACVRADASVTYLLLGLAIMDQKRKRDKDSKMREKVREWWKEVEEVRKDRGWNGLQGEKGKERIKEAKELGLIEVEEIKGKVRQEVKK